MDASKRNIGDIINKYLIPEIPFFQGLYVWGGVQWSRLLYDLEQVSQSGKPHFLGSAILKQLPTETQSGIGERRLMVDGHQRLTTLFLFFKAMSFKLDDADGYFRNWTISEGGIPMLNNRLDRIDGRLHRSIRLERNDHRLTRRISRFEDAGGLAVRSLFLDFLSTQFHFNSQCAFGLMPEGIQKLNSDTVKWKKWWGSRYLYVSLIPVYKRLSRTGRNKSITFTGTFFQQKKTSS